MVSPPNTFCKSSKLKVDKFFVDAFMMLLFKG